MKKIREPVVLKVVLPIMSAVGLFVAMTWPTVHAAFCAPHLPVVL